LAADPAAELGHRALMRAFVMTDRHGEAIRHIDQCHAAMLQAGRRALEPETQALIEELRGSPIPEGTRVERFDLPSADIQIPPKPKPVAPRAKPPKPPVGMGRADRTMASIVVAYLPELAAFDLRFDPAAIERAEARFRDFAARVAEESEGALVADTGAWIVMRFSDPGQAGLGALLLAAEPIAVDGGPPVAASCGIAHGMIQARTSGLAGVPVAVASRGAMLAQTGEVLAHEVMSPSLGRDFALSTGVEGYVVVAAQAGEPERIETAQMHGALPPSGPELEVAQAGLDAAALSPQEHWSRWLKALERGDLRGARDQGERIAQDPRPEVGALAPAALGVVRFLRGQLPSAGEALQAVDATQPAEHDLPLDPGLIGRAVLAWLRALEGAPGPAAEDLRRVMSEAQSAGAAGDVQVCSVVAAIVQDELGDARASIGAAREAAKRIAEGTVWHALARAVVGRARDRAGEAAGVSQIEEGLKAYRAMGGTLAAPLLQTWLATAQLELGDTRKGLALVDDALGQTTASDALIWEPELLRLQAVLLVRHGGIERSELETCFVAALESARRTGAALHELRIATSFASYLYGLGRVRDAMARLDRGIAGIKPGGPITLDMKSALSLRRRVEMG
ncbi:MAG: bacterial transcriptional activator domain-containing protein, partial [Pseudomonadota bacterium]